MTVLDMSPFIAPKSTELSGDDLLAGEKVITITNVTLVDGEEKPCIINFEGDNGKPWRPCKSMGRVLVKAWGPDAKSYAGKSLLLYRDPDVLWGGMKVGGVRIKALSHITAPFDIALTATRGKKAMSRFFPLKPEDLPQQREDAAKAWANGFIGAVTAATDADALDAVLTKAGKAYVSLQSKRPELHAECEHAVAMKRGSFEVAPEVSDDADMGDGFTDDFGGE